MPTTLTKEDFKALDFDVRCVIIEALLTDDYYTGQMNISFYFVEPENAEKLPPKTPEMEEREDLEFNELVERLTNKLFENQSSIEYDMSEFAED